MDYRHREVIKKYSSFLQQRINFRDADVKKSLRESKIFTAHMLRDIYEGEASFFEELPTRGPEAFSRFINLLEKIHLAPVAEKLLHVTNPAYQISDNHGCFHIILNYEFEGIENSKELKRGFTLEASTLDSALQKDFVNHKFQSNLKADQILSELKKFSKMDSLQFVNSCIVIILGFGTKYEDSEVIYGSNGEYILLSDILDLFSDTNCLNLKHKPKIFLLPSFDDSVEKVNLPTDVNDVFIWNFPPLKMYKYINNIRSIDFFGEILSKNIGANHLKYDFETVLRTSYEMFLNQFKKENIIIDDISYISDCKKLGYCREKILFIPQAS